LIFQYYSDSDMIYIKFSDKTSNESEEVAPGIVLDFDEQNQIVGIEIEDASKFIDLSSLEIRALPISSLIFTERLPVENLISKS
jgi:uncharacterized protein YuzE